ncbi:hypothetical protein FAI40_03990 [Acetobacteraceae bacterium]|nr:hypothetical protein FAI40_03990 [Acetobacteraceae bacterium]
MTVFEENGRLTGEGLEVVGSALFGEKWKNPLGKALGVGGSRIRGVIQGVRRSPSGWTPEIKEMLESQIDRCKKALSSLEES